MKTRLMVLVIVLVMVLIPTSVIADPIDAFETDGWRYKAAGIVAGEAPHGCVECYELTACQLIRDAQDTNPWAVVTPGPDRRWHGWKTPKTEHLQAVNRMLSQGCDVYPSCRFLGNKNDLRHFLLVYPDLVLEIVGFCDGNGGCSICVVNQEVEEAQWQVSGSTNTEY
jgi:hypothetical protein